MPVSDDAILIAAAIIMAAPAKPANEYGTMADCIRVANLLANELSKRTEKDKI